jgi:hypothetical protein
MLDGDPSFEARRGMFEEAPSSEIITDGPLDSFPRWSLELSKLSKCFATTLEGIVANKVSCS